MSGKKRKLENLGCLRLDEVTSFAINADELHLDERDVSSLSYNISTDLSQGAASIDMAGLTEEAFFSDAESYDEPSSESVNFIEEAVTSIEEHLNIDLSDFENLINSTKNTIHEEESSLVDLVDEFSEDIEYAQSEDDFEYQLFDEDYLISDSEEPTSAPKEEDPFLFDGSDIRLSAAMVLILAFSVRFSLSNEALSHLIKLIHLLLPKKSKFCKSLFLFKEHFKMKKHQTVHSVYCNSCLEEIDKNDKKCSCGFDLTTHSSKGYMIKFSIMHQLQNLFRRPGFYKNLQYRFSRTVHDCFNDIYDGNLYKKMLMTGVLSNPNNISFLFNTDGVPLFKSSKISLWPIFLVINELPPYLRFKNENMIFSGLWYSSTKPHSSILLQPLYKELSMLEKGFYCDVHMENNHVSKVLVKGFLLAGTFDLPARSMICGMIQFNGHFGCIKCYQEGKSHQTKKGGNVWVYPYSNSENSLRESCTFKNDSLIAIKTNKIVNGVKFPTFLHGLSSFDLVHGIGIDYMHGVLLGVMKLLLKLWFSAPLKNEKFSAYNNLSKLDSRLVQLKPTLEITRLPRSFSKHGSDWKASEYRNFLLFFGVPLLSDILPACQLAHFSLLSHSVYNLLKHSISKDKLHASDEMITKFCTDFSSIYGERYMLYNVHQLLHLCHDVFQLGPLWSHSCFPFEDKNNFILKLVHGSQSIDTQICTAVDVVQQIPEIVEQYISRSEEQLKFYQRMLGKRQNLATSNQKEISSNFSLIGCPMRCQFTDSTFTLVSNYFGYPLLSKDFLKYTRILLNREIFHSKEYARCFRRDSTCICYKENESSISYGTVLYFLEFSSVNKLYHFTLIESFTILCENENSHLIVIKNEENYVRKVIPVRNIVAKVMRIDYDELKDHFFITHFPNKEE